VEYGCAFCGEENEVFVDTSGGRQQTVQSSVKVCRRPNLITLIIDDDGEVDVEVTQEYEA